MASRRPREVLEFSGAGLSGMARSVQDLTERIARDIRLTQAPMVARELAAWAAAEASQIARDEDLLHTGEYLEAYGVQPTRLGGDTVNLTEYAGVIELGRRPGRRPPPLREIRRWVVDKIMGGVDGPEAGAMAKRVRDKIAREGTPAKRVLMRVYLSDAKIRAALQAALARRDGG